MKLIDFAERHLLPLAGTQTLDELRVTLRTVERGLSGAAFVVLFMTFGAAIGSSRLSKASNRNRQPG
ncbi:protein of unknown function [Candidatus Filomicrobium marinum]|uniref:Uncharacterized protein n=1 Tax=Candidatus Filomicrobium marinum TaxID=1608628 RepID=A0A0D6J9S9_9HYPH|nr:hypothetical protein [Candidatus Filomicrobium marinum]CFW99215.1 protein of unknown function [Candidatus Filomicrobium marinum]CPR15019.1 protein of unknown function [Candidatus Filomicrobium marinum]